MARKGKRVELYMVQKRPMTIKGGEVRNPGDLIPEAVNFSARATKSLIDNGLMAKVVVVSQKQYKKLEGALSASR